MSTSEQFFSTFPTKKSGFRTICTHWWSSFFRKKIDFEHKSQRRNNFVHTLRQKSGVGDKRPHWAPALGFQLNDKKKRLWAQMTTSEQFFFPRFPQKKSSFAKIYTHWWSSFVRKKATFSTNDNFGTVFFTRYGKKSGVDDKRPHWAPALDFQLNDLLRFTNHCIRVGVKTPKKSGFGTSCTHWCPGSSKK